MFIFFLVVLLLIPLTMVGFGGRWQKSPPKEINMAYGYRTTWSMKNQNTWNFAHSYAGKIWFYTGVPLAVTSVVFLTIFRNLVLDELGDIVLIITAFQIVCIFLPIPLTEIALRKKFNKDGSKKI